MTAPAWRLTEAGLRAHGDALALTGIGPDVRYGTFAGRALAVADALRTAGVQAGHCVAIVSATRAHDEAVALAGVLLAEAVAVPLDAGSPPARLGRIVAERACQAIVYDEAARERVRALLAAAVTTADTDSDGDDPGVARVELDGEGMITASIGDATGDAAPLPVDVACVLHTSGSTGTPKAVPMRWAGHDAFTAWMIALCQLRLTTRVLRVAELTFDLSWFDHLASFRAGATLCICSRRHLATGRSLVDQIRIQRPEVIYGVPALFMKIVDCAREPIDHVATLCFAGEVYPPRELSKLPACFPNARMFNLYGPTETNVCTFHQVDPGALDGSSELPIGLPTPFAECTLRDPDGRQLEGAATGELVVRGPTALAGEVATGDRVQRDECGVYLFRGRLDRMVKLRGYRVEPGEVESVLRQHPAVRAAAVAVTTHPRLGKVLRAHVTVTAQQDLRGELRAFVARQLAPYMVPESVTVHDALPRTATGKVDYPALAAI